MTADARLEPAAVLFDLGGVLMDYGGLGRLAELTGEDDGPALAARWSADERVRAFERGRCDARSFAEGVVEAWGVDLSPEAFLRDFRRWSRGPFPGAAALLRRLHGTVRTGCLSNTNPVHWDQHLHRWGLVEHLDWAFVSHELGALKPAPAVFAHVVRTIGGDPGRVLFLDDSAENVAAARESGLRAERTRGLDEVRGALIAAFPPHSSAGRAVRADPRS